MGVLRFIFFIGAYIFGALCLQAIAKKVNKEPAWLAWIPIGNLFLLCKIAGLKYWWLFIFFAAVMPILGILAVLGFLGYAWYRVALALKKPGWIGALAALPLAGLISVGYLAFSD